ncbi:hypothetical protein SBF1_5150004 [Candidatus Desulfosporosinus infrequens]|uniref:CRISPR-associated endonuclease Cas1 n=1 Tax=Candidatus Desulfosporosinus infrequens TaxID=2043169 RepID=A0A2U3LI97_9FIRM|nr:hypothetical protein SBF1_5150004 [Candidatus Desulfosporosinus infrequens]
MSEKIMVLNGHGIDIRVNSGHLKIKEGFPFKGNITEHYLDRGLNDIEHLVILGQTGSITIDAIKWMMDQDMIVSFLDPDGNIVTDFIPQNNISGIVKRRQATPSNSFNLEISSWLLSEKFKQQRNTLIHLSTKYRQAIWWTEEREQRIEKALTISSNREELLVSSLNPDAQRVLEAQAAAAYWPAFEGVELSWQKSAKIPNHWRTIGNRTSPKSCSPRKAIDPFHAGLNYLYAVLETKFKRSCFINGIDSDFGIIHADHANRASLVYDLIEPLRPKVDKVLFDWCMATSFNKKQFFETREGVCRIAPDVVSNIIPFVSELDRDVENIVKGYASYFKNKWVVQRPGEFAENEPDRRKSANKVERKAFKYKEVSLPTPSVKINTEKPSNQFIPPAIENLVTDNVDNETSGFFCLECGIAFVPEKPGQRFCGKTHKDTYRKRLLRQKRVSEGKCPQCGRPMEQTAEGTYKDRLTYCNDCMEYWKRKYREKKA